MQREKAGMRHPDMADLLREATMLEVRIEERTLSPHLCGFYWEKNRMIMLHEIPLRLLLRACPCQTPRLRLQAGWHQRRAQPCVSRHPRRLAEPADRRARP